MARSTKRSSSSPTGEAKASRPTPARAIAAPLADPPPPERCEPAEHARRLGRAPVTDAQLERAAAIFRAAGDISRLKLLDRLCGGEWCVTELAEAAGVGLSTVSQQLRLLRAERIVTRRRAGKHIFYSLADAHVIDLLQSAIDHAGEHDAAHGP